MNFKKAFTYIFEDPNWLEKLIVPLLVGLIPIVGQLALSGYVMRVIQNVAQRTQPELPSFDFGLDLGKGFRWFLVALVYSLPVMLFSLLFLWPTFRLENNGNDTIAIIVLILIGLLFFLLLLAFAFILPIAQVNFAVKDTFASAFDFKTLFKLIKNNIVAWLMVLAGTVIAGFISPLGGIVFVIGAMVTAFYGQLFVAHLAGQAYALSQTPGGQGVAPF